VGLAGLSAGLSALMEMGWEAVERSERETADELRRILRSVPGVRLLGEPRGAHARPTTATVSFLADWLPPAELGAVLDEQFDVAVRTGLHCAPLAHTAMGTLPDGAVRASAGLNAAREQLQQFEQCLRELASAFTASA
jgi:selenocysteine lyase/cysteine desulfurase